MKRLSIAAAALLIGAPIAAQDSFLDSDAYTKGEGIVGVMLGDDEYRLMRRGGRLFDSRIDWAWVPGLEEAERDGPPSFPVADYRSIVVETPVDHTAEPIDGLPQVLHEVLIVSTRRVGWSPAEQGDLVLSTAIVDVVDAEGSAVTGFFNATKEHALEVEFKLIEAESGRLLLAVRDEVNSGNLVGAMWRAAAHLTSLLAPPSAPRYAGRGISVSLDEYTMPPTRRNRPHELERYANPREIALGALRSSGLFDSVAEESNDTDFGLAIEVLDANFVGAYQTTVNVNANYTLTDRQSGRVHFWNNVGTSATLSAADIRKGGERMQSVTPAAFLNNVDVFLLRLDAELDELE